MPKPLLYVIWVAAGIALAAVLVYFALALRLTNLLFMPVVSGTRLPPTPINPQSAAQASEVILRDQMWRIERTIDLLTLIMAVGTIALGFAAFIGFQVFAGLIEEGARRAAERYSKKFHNDALARLLAEEAYIHWRVSTEGEHAPPDLSDAIRRAEHALKQTDPNSLDVLAHVKTTLAYYYAQAGVREKKDVALEYAKWAREQMHKISWPPPTVLIANDLYVRMRYDNRRSQLEAVREDLLENLDMYASDQSFCAELREYQVELDKKLRAL